VKGRAVLSSLGGAARSQCPRWVPRGLAAGRPTRSQLRQLARDRRRRTAAGGKPGCADAPRRHALWPACRRSSTRRPLVQFFRWASRQPDTWFLTFRQYVSYLQAPPGTKVGQVLRWPRRRRQGWGSGRGRAGSTEHVVRRLWAEGTTAGWSAGPAGGRLRLPKSRGFAPGAGFHLLVCCLPCRLPRCWRISSVTTSLRLADKAPCQRSGPFSTPKGAATEAPARRRRPRYHPASAAVPAWASCLFRLHLLQQSSWLAGRAWPPRCMCPKRRVQLHRQEKPATTTRLATCRGRPWVGVAARCR
jgi:hypothetical protein